MSRAYRIAAKASDSRVVRVEDGVCSAIELLEVLPKESMADLLAAELAKEGFERDGKSMKRTDEDGMEVEVDLEKGTVTARVKAARKVGHEVERSVTVGARTDHAEEEVQQAANRELERRFEESRRELREEASKKLEGKLKDLQGALDKASNRATAEALKVKARSLGEIEELSEDKESGNVTIKVRV